MKQVTKYPVTALFEIAVEPGDGNYYLVIYGKHINGYFCAIPNFKVGCEMAEPTDTFYNCEQLTAAGIADKAAKSIVRTIKEFAAAQNIG